MKRIKDRKQEMKDLWFKISDSQSKICESGPYVYKVPREIRKQNGSAYTPRLFSIGPLHIRSGDKLLQLHTEDIKRFYVGCLLEEVAGQLNGVDEQQLAEKLEGLVRAGKLKPFKDVDARGLTMQLQDESLRELLLLICMEQMELYIEEAKNYYPEEAREAVNAEMLVTDGCFIIYFLQHFEKGEKDMPKKEKKKKWCGDVGYKSSSKNKEVKMVSSGGAASSSSPGEPRSFDPIFPARLVSVLRDLLLLENQLPFFVLDNLFSLTLGLLPHSKHISLERYILNCFCGTLEMGHDCTLKPKSEVPDQQQHCVDVDDQEDKQKCKYDHILHVVHDHYLPRRPRNEELADDIKFMPSASVLDDAAVKFVVPKDKFTVKFEHQSCSCRGFFCFHRARFEIPTLSIFDITEAVLRNFIAFEQCRPGVIHPYFTSYAFLMDRLINTEADAQVLEEATVIQNFLGCSGEVSRLFNNLSREVILYDFLFNQELEEAANYNKHHRSAWLLVIGHYLQRRLSATPYTFIAFVIGFLLVAMQVADFIISLTR